MGAPQVPDAAEEAGESQKREARLDAHAIAWRDAFFDLIAGKPHLPSLPPAGAEPAGPPATPAATEPGED